MIRRFDPREEQQIAELKAYWDSKFGRPAGAAVANDLDPGLRDTIDQIHAVDDAPPASAAFESALLARLMEAAQTADRGPEGPQEPTHFLTHLPQPKVPAGRERRRARVGVSRIWAAISAGSLVLVVMAIIAGFSIWNARQASDNGLVPLRTVTTSNGVVIRTLLEERVPAGVLTTNPTEWIASFKYTLEPGEAWRDSPSRCELARKYVVGLVESGTLAMINTGPFEIRRSNGSRETIAAGQRGEVHSGDSWVYFSDRTEIDVQKWNPGSANLVAYETNWWLDRSCEFRPMNPEQGWHGYSSGRTIDSSFPLTVTFEQVFVGPGESLSLDDAVEIGLIADEASVFNVVGIESGTLEHATVPVALAPAPAGSSEQIWTLTLKPGERWSPQMWGSARGGFEWQFRNSSDQTLVMTTISWTYDIDGTGDAPG